MKIRLLQLILLIMTFVTGANAQGFPLFRNISPAEYQGHKQNFDIEIDDNGLIVVANFEGLLYYDNAQWRKVYTPNITRTTVVFRDSKGKVWVGGYNFFGYVKVRENGELELKNQDEIHEFKGEVQDIWEEAGQLYFSVSNGNIYTAKQNEIFLSTTTKGNPYDYEPVVPNSTVSWKEKLDDGWTAVSTEGNGLFIVNKNGQIIYQLTEEDGLCSNNIVSLAYNKHGLLWGVTDNGIFVMQVPSPYTFFSHNTGLRGEVLSLAKLGNQMFAGTPLGVFWQQGQKFEQVGKMNYACWQLESEGNSLLAATPNGVYRIMHNGTTQQLTTANTTALLVNGNGFYSGESDGVFYHEPGKQPIKVCEAERATKFIKDKQGVIWIQNLYGRIWNNEKGQFNLLTAGNNNEEIATLVMIGDQPTIVNANSTKPVPYPLYAFTDNQGIIWLTDNKGKKLYAIENGSKHNKWNTLVYPLMEHTVRAVLHERDKVWIGTADGLHVANATKMDLTKSAKPTIFFRAIEINDSVTWGGFTDMPKHLVFENDQKHITIRFSIDFPSLLLRTQYRYRINNGKWSAWDNDTFAEYNNQSFGIYTFEVQARDAFGQQSDIISLHFEIKAPFYFRWYMILLYLLILSLLAYATMRWRLSRLEKDKQRLESIVQERTAEVVKQKNEIEEKSKSLETALNELGEAQSELVRQEKMATVGKLTQGLIDRILNPLNYINNFAKLSEGLVDDVRDNIEDEKEHISPENFNDTMDVLTMLKGNLQKVGEHGANTTRTLKAMEEVMKDRSSGIIKMDLLPMIHKDEEMLNTYYEKDITKHHIKCVFEYPDTSIYVNANPELLSTSLMSLLNNALYAVVKKAKRKEFVPEIDVILTMEGDSARIIIRDNGLGIEDTIIHKIFDPFFTTKTTGEASGVGLYLSREVIQNYGGDIQVKSQKDEYTEFTITIPTTK